MTQSSQARVSTTAQQGGDYFSLCETEWMRVCIWDSKKEKDWKQREKGVNEKWNEWKECSESSDPNHKHSDESPDNGFSVDLLEPATADPQHTAPQATHETAAPHYSFRGRAIEWEERREETARPLARLTQVMKLFLMMIKAGIQNHILPE